MKLRTKFSFMRFLSLSPFRQKPPPLPPDPLPSPSSPSSPSTSTLPPYLPICGLEEDYQERRLEKRKREGVVNAAEFEGENDDYERIREGSFGEEGEGDEGGERERRRREEVQETVGLLVARSGGDINENDHLSGRGILTEMSVSVLMSVSLPFSLQTSKASHGIVCRGRVLLTAHTEWSTSKSACVIIASMFNL